MHSFNFYTAYMTETEETENRRRLEVASEGGVATHMLRRLKNLDGLIGYVIINYGKNTRFSAILTFPLALNYP